MKSSSVNQCVYFTRWRDFNLDCKLWHGASFQNIKCNNFRVIGHFIYFYTKGKHLFFNLPITLISDASPLLMYIF